MKDKQTINFEWQTKFGQALGQTKAQKKLNKRGWRGRRGGQQITWTLGRVGSRERGTGHDFSRINEIPNGRAKCQNEMSDLNGCTHLNGPRPLPTPCKRNREQDSWMDSWTALQLNGWLDGWIDWTDWRPKCQSTFAVEARRRSMSMRCECRKCWPPVHKLKALSQHTHTHQSEQWTPPKPPWNENEKWYFWFCGHS